MTLVGPVGTTEADGGACSVDAFAIVNSPFVPVICGENSGQHSQFPLKFMLLNVKDCFLFSICRVG